MVFGTVSTKFILILRELKTWLYTNGRIGFVGEFKAR